MNTRAALGLVVCLTAGPALAQDDVYTAGAQLQIETEVRGDLLAAGGTVAVTQSVHGDAMLAGGTVDLRAPVGDDLRAAGGSVSLSSAVGDDAVVAGGRVHLTRTASVGGRAWLAGGEVVIDGRVAGALRAAGSTLVLAGTVGGHAELAGETVELRPGAHVAGDLVYRSPSEARIPPDARVDGEIRHLPFGAPAIAPAARTAGRLVALTAIAVTGFVLYLVFPQFAMAAARTLGTAPWRALALGFASLVAIPVLVLLLLVSVIGIPLALALLAVYLIMLLAGFLIGVLYLGDLGLTRLAPGRAGSRLGVAAALVLALAVLWLVQLIPVLGGLVTFLILLFGTGALLLGVYQRYGTARPGVA